MPGHVRARSSGSDGTARAPVIFGDFCLDPANATLKRGAAAIALTPKAFGVLELLVARAGQLVTKDEFLDRLWPGVFVGDAVLKVCVREIRHALGDDHHQPTFIETVHKRGYRFVAAVSTVAPAAPAADALEFTPPQTHYAQSGDVSIAYQVVGDGPIDSRVRDGVGLAPRLLLGRTVVRALPAPAGLVLAPDPLRQTRHRPVRSRRRAAHARAADGRRARGARRRRLATGGAARGVRGRPAVRALRHHLPGADPRAGDDRDLRQAALGAGVSVGADRRGGRALPRGDPAHLGRTRRSRGARADGRRRPRVPRLVEHLPAHGRQPRRGGGPDAHERRDRRPRRAAGDPRPDADPAPHRGSPADDRRGTLRRVADPRRHADRAARRGSPAVRRRPGHDARRHRALPRSRARRGRRRPRAGDHRHRDDSTRPGSGSAARQAFEAQARADIDRQRGRLLAFTPTQIQAAFDGPARAIRCAATLVAAGARADRAVRAGLHTGECEVVAGEMRGVAVALSSDLAALARSGEVLVSRTLVDLVAGSGLEFESRGPKPFGDNGDRFEIFAVRTPAA